MTSKNPRILVGATVLATVVAIACLYLWQPVATPGARGAVLVLALLALVADLLALALPATASGSIAFIAYWAMVLVVPSWPGVLAVVAVRTAVEFLNRREFIKAIFNIANHGLSQTLATATYVALGGVSFLTMDDRPISYVTVVAGVPGVLACVVAIATNTLLTSAVISSINRVKLLGVWRTNHRETIALDLICTALVFVFAWIYVQFGWIVAVAAWIPILGIRQVYKTFTELELAHQELLQLIVKSIEARDPYTSGHSRRVSKLSLTIARAAGLNDREVDRIGVAALLHDVGKIHDKYAPILAKPDRLSAEEWLTMQEHPVDGANLVATISRLRDIVPAIRGHHEAWDGTGYPDGLAGERIPLGSRIISFADTIDSMMSERPYRRPLDEHDVRAEIVRCRGKQFDPRLADIVLTAAVWEKLFHRSGAIAPAKSLSLVHDRAGEPEPKQRLVR
jgi:putative nucleotidyltransferase with HDIG domain